MPTRKKQQPPQREERKMVLTNEQMVYQYFNLISQKDVKGLLDLFIDDAIVYEPFSNLSQGLQGKSAIENFMKVVVMANAGLRRESIEFVEKTENSITAMVMFERGGRVEGKMMFNFVIDPVAGEKKIKMLRIEFPKD